MSLFPLTPRRVALDATSWIEHVPGWLASDAADALFADLIRSAAWEQRERRIVDQLKIEPRLTAEYSVAEAPFPALRAAAERLTTQYGVTYDGLWINHYRDHRDSTGWHGDWASCRRTVCIVPVLSLGATRRFLIKPRAGGRSVGFSPEHGDLIVMGGRAQRDWLHAVPKSATAAGARLSVNFSSTAQGVPD